VIAAPSPTGPISSTGTGTGTTAGVDADAGTAGTKIRVSKATVLVGDAVVKGRTTAEADLLVPIELHVAASGSSLSRETDGLY
jgi:hypothetical protein